MANVSISEASRLAGKGRATVQRHIKTGKLSVTRDGAGNIAVDTAELLRVYGSIQAFDAPAPAPLIQDETADVVEALLEELRAAKEREKEALEREKQAQEREAWLKTQIEAEQARSRELLQRMLPPGEESAKGILQRLFGG